MKCVNFFTIYKDTIFATKNRYCHYFLKKVSVFLKHFVSLLRLTNEQQLIHVKCLTYNYDKIMKKFLAIAIISLTMATAQAMTVNDVINVFGNDYNVEKLDVTNLKHILSKAGNKMPAGLENIEAVKVVFVQNPTAKQFNIVKQIQQVPIDGMELMHKTGEKGENVAVYSSSLESTTGQMLIMAVNNSSQSNEVMLMLVTGKINAGDVDKLINIRN